MHQKQYKIKNNDECKSLARSKMFCRHRQPVCKKMEGNLCVFVFFLMFLCITFPVSITMINL